MNKAELLDRIKTERARWETQLAKVGAAHMEEAGAAGEWSIKDVIAHITWHEREMVGMIQAHALVGSDLWQLPLDERNAEIFREHKDRPLQDVLEEAPVVYQQFLEAVGTLSEEDVTDPRRFPGMPLEWEPWQVIAGNSYEHYEQHLQDLARFATGSSHAAAGLKDGWAA